MRRLSKFGYWMSISAVFALTAQIWSITDWKIASFVFGAGCFLVLQVERIRLDIWEAEKIKTELMIEIFNQIRDELLRK